MSLQITDIAFTLTPVTDMKKARAFYEGVLGLVPARFIGPDDESYVEYDVGPGKTTLALATGLPGWKPATNSTAIVFEVADLDAAVAHLKAGNITFLCETLEFPVCRMAIVTDPDGNTVTLHQCKKKPENLKA